MTNVGEPTELDGDLYTRKLQLYVTLNRWSQRQVAAIAQTSQSTVSRWLSGDGLPNIREWDLITTAHITQTAQAVNAELSTTQSWWSGV